MLVYSIVRWWCTFWLERTLTPMMWMLSLIPGCLEETLPIHLEGWHGETHGVQTDIQVFSYLRTLFHNRQADILHNLAVSLLISTSSSSKSKCNIQVTVSSIVSDKNIFLKLLGLYKWHVHLNVLYTSMIHWYLSINQILFPFSLFKEILPLSPFLPANMV